MIRTTLSETVNIRVRRSTRNKLKVEATLKNMTLMDYIDEIAK